MPSESEYVEFVHLPSYLKSAAGLIDDAAQRRIEAALVENPEAGAVMVGTGGVRKLRVATSGRGKRGGARLIYYYRQSKGRIYLILLYPKSRKDNLTAAERNAMRTVTAAIEVEG